MLHIVHNMHVFSQELLPWFCHYFDININMVNVGLDGMSTSLIQYGTGPESRTVDGLQSIYILFHHLNLQRNTGHYVALVRYYLIWCRCMLYYAVVVYYAVFVYYAVVVSVDGTSR